jgi:formylglycine-generating enzyme required for sulfatase activity/uncharacterized protein YjdB
VEIVAVTGITGVPGTVTVGKPLTLTGTVEPEGATNRDIAWSVKDPGGTGAAISGGTLSVTATGTVKVTATIAKGKSETEDYTEDFEITAAAWVAVTGITGVPTTAYAKRPLTLSGTVAPAAATNKAITWSVKSAGGTGATVNGNTLTTTAAGTVTVTATITNGTNATTHYTQDFDITVQAVAVTGVSLDTATLTVGRGETATLAATIEPADATNKVVSWASGNEAVATVNNGVVTGVGVGTAVITVTTTDGGFTASCTVTVTEPAAGDLMTRTVNSNMTINFRYVPAGSFQRDATAANISIISKGYWLGETEVTQELFDAILPGNTYNFPDNPATDEIQTKRPAEMVNWYAAIAFCNKLSLADGKEPVYSVKVSNVEVDWTNLAYSAIPTTNDTNWNGATQDLTKNGYRLPTEMEWMWAAMGADKTDQPNTTGYQKKYAGSTESGTAIVNIGDYAWYTTNSGSKTHEVGKKTANELNLYDMSGNLWEWCWDRHNSSIPAGEQIDYAGAASGTARVIKGGNWNLDASYCSLTTRSNPSHQSRASDIGFRVVCPAQ